MRVLVPLVATGLIVLAVIGLTTASAQKDAKPAAESTTLDPKVVTVRLLLGVGEAQASDWTGKVKIDKGEVVGLEGWRFRQNDEVQGTSGWDARTRLTKAAAKKKAAAAAKKGDGPAAKKKGQFAAAKKKGAGAGFGGGAVSPNGVFVALKAPDDARLTIETAQGNFNVPLADVADGSIQKYLDGKVEAQLVPTAATLYDGSDQEDFPAAAPDAGGNIWVACVVHQARGPVLVEPLSTRPTKFADYVPKDGGDQVRLLRYAAGKVADTVEITGPGLDVWRPAVAVDKNGAVVVVWSENRDGNWDLYQCTYLPEKRGLSEPVRLTRGAGTDTDAVLAAAPDGKIWMAWQSWSEGRSDILLAPVDANGSAAAPQRISDGPADEWSPSIAIDRGGRIHVAYDTYQAGNYDVMLRTRNPDGTLTSPRAVAASPNYEVRPSVAIDPQGRVWVAYEERAENWGKDFGPLDESTSDGTALYRSAAVKVRCLDGDRLLEAPDSVAAATPVLQGFNSFPRICAERSGRIWLVYRHRQEGQSSGVGGTWIGYATALAGKAWTVPAPVPQSDGMLDNRAALVVPGDGPVLVIYDGDKRFSQDGNVVRHGLHAALLSSSARIQTVNPALAEAARDPLPAAPPLHPNEAADIARMRAHRIQAGGKTYQLLRGEFHRHTEISPDGGGDGALEDLWRYALDCADLDWIGNGDHDNGQGKEYTWWLTQKSTDLYHAPPRFTPMFTYERSVQFPNGHRNVMWAHRGVRSLPRLQNPGGGTHDDDTKMLYDYLKELGGICASHTSATSGMGTDWRDNDPVAEPIVEIYQGDRNSYEALGAPRVARRPDEGIAGFQPYGLVWNALALQYKLGFQSSSDHISTHISYGVVLAERHDRAAILDAFRKRHCYAATDNILMDVRSGDHLMGDEFDADGPVRLKVLVHGTRPISRIDVIKDFSYVYSTEPRTERAAFEWTDEEPRTTGLSWYYVRAIQDDGELAWGSPFWIHRTASGAGGE
jgi:hypothetical protein